MSAYFAFTKKEFIEHTRTYKLLILLAVFLAFGILAPLTAKLMPQVLSTLMPAGMTITLGEPKALDAWTQFYKNMSSLQLVILVVVFSGTLVNELHKGTLINMLTKGLGRTTVLLSKFTAMACLWTLSYLLCLGVSYGYTLVLLPENDLPGIFAAALGMWLYGILLLAALLLGSTLVNNIYGVLLFTGAFAVLLMLLGMIPGNMAWNPGLLASANMGLLSGQMLPADFTGPLLTGSGLSVLFVGLAVILFRKKQL